VTTGE